MLPLEQNTINFVFRILFYIDFAQRTLPQANRVKSPDSLDDFQKHFKNDTNITFGNAITSCK